MQLKNKGNICRN